MIVPQRIYNWYKKHETVQWITILVPLWIQPFHMWAMGEQVAHAHGIINLDELTYHLSQWSFWSDLFWLSIDYLEFVAIFTGTEKFVRHIREKRKKKREIS